jgi:hypothetical protein
VGETSVVCCVGSNPKDPAGTVVDADVDDAEVPRDGVDGRLGIVEVADADGVAEGGGGKNGDRVRRPRGASMGEGDDVDGE